MPCSSVIERMLRGIPMKNEKPLLIMILTTSVLLFGDLLYRVQMKPQNLNDLLVVMGGVAICSFLVLPRLVKDEGRLYRGVKGGVIGAVLGIGGVALRDYLTKGSLNWGSYLSTALGFALAFILILVLAQLIRWRRN